MLPAIYRTGGCGPTWATALLTAFASTRKTLSGTGTFPTSGACMFAKVARCCRRSPWIVVASHAHSEGLTRGRYSWWQPSGVERRAWQAAGYELAKCSPLKRRHRASGGRSVGAAWTLLHG